MRATEIIRSVLDLIDQVDSPEEAEGAAIQITLGQEPSPEEINPPSDVNHFKQIVDLIQGSGDSMFANSPEEKIADIDSVTVNAGGGINGPKHPADIRADSVAMYPGANHVR
jgi:hypothetical protein